MRSGGDKGTRRGTELFAFAAAFFTCAALPLLSMAAAAAQERALCTEMGAAVAVAEAAGARDGATIQLKDGRVVRLAGVIAPAELDGDADAIARAHTALDGLIAGRRVALHGQADARDRYGRLVAQVTLANEALWVQAALVRAGKLRVAPGTGEPDCARALLAEELRARAVRAGLWSVPRFAVQRAVPPAALLESAGRFAVVEGRIVRIGEAGGRIFLDFGRRYRRAFTIVVPQAAQKAFAAAGIDLRGLSGKRVRARGMIYAWGGPAVEIKVPAALEILGADGI